MQVGGVGNPVIDPIYSAIGARLSAFRKTNSQTQEEASRALGLTQSAYARLESGETAIRIDQLLILASFWGVSARKILGTLLD